MEEMEPVVVTVTDGRKEQQYLRSEAQEIVRNSPHLWIVEDEDKPSPYRRNPLAIEGEYTVKDSGQRVHYDNGFVRDTEAGKEDLVWLFAMPDLDLIPPMMLTRWVEHMRKGAVKYGRNNWTQAEGPEAVARFKRSAIRHMNQWLRGETDEDHVSAMVFNVWAAEVTKEKMNGS
jgi:hypothetical protein